jgi:hypothetical protein
MTLGNIPRAIRRKPSQQACFLLGYLSVDKILKDQLSEREISSRAQRLFHDSLALILAPLKDAGTTGIEVIGGDGAVRLVFPVLACYIADYPEQCLVTCSKYGTCPKCLARSDELGEIKNSAARTQSWTMDIINHASSTTNSNSTFKTKCMEDGVSGGVFQPFWTGFPHCDIHLSIMPDVLHQIYQGVFKHMVEWLSALMEPEELDTRLRSLPPCYGL